MANNLYKALRNAVVISALSAIYGCSAAGVAIDRTVGPTVSAKYVPSKTESMLVLVESYGLSLDSGIEAQHMTIVLNKSLTDQKIATMVDPQSLERLRDANPAQYKPLTIADIGRKVGARQVLYVNIWRSEIVKPAGSGQMRGQMEAVVKIVDTATGDTRWPSDAPSDTVQITTDWTPESAQKTENDLRAQMADQMAEDISKLFHDYHPDQEPMEKINID
jgi:hypothetical protein